MTSPTRVAREAQMFPLLEAEDVARMRRFGVQRHYVEGTRIAEIGKPSPGLIVVLSGAIRVSTRDTHGHDLAVIDHVPGAFSGELGLLSGRRSFVDAKALGDVEALVIEPRRLHELLVAEASLGERIMRALILRRVAFIETGAGGPTFVGEPSSASVARLRSFLTRNGIPHAFLDPAVDDEARAFVERYAPRPEDLPLVVCPDGSVLRNPTEAQLARCIGMLDAGNENEVYDVIVAGAGPAGLAAAVYASSEGLSALVVDERAFGGQAGASARIENYLGFPTGISGQALAARAFTQAQKFGARMLIPASIEHLDCGKHPFEVRLADGRALRGRSVVIASGARYRRPECSNLQSMEGRGVWYWASPIEARMCAGEEVVLVGGGNSAGQAAVFLSGYAKKVWMLVRGPGLAASMSKYLIDRIAGIGNIELRTRSEIVHLDGAANGVDAVTWRHRDTGEKEKRAIRNVFLFLGADPCTEWLKDCDVAIDGKGFVTTGQNRSSPLETTVQGVFAIGDVRAGSVKRVGSAIGEGAAAVAQIHAYLAQLG
ncbi:MAG: FAD-dependent oxidoreductase [Betaproteobacteria bacterium]|nr:FAD-dependent oxidoreductase [Betaproteobacteria bacterium]